MIPSQMLKGVLEGCILKIISENETYGYEIVEKCKSYGLFDLSEGTIYPLLLRLERNALIQADYKESDVYKRQILRLLARPFCDAFSENKLLYCSSGEFEWSFT